MSVVRKYFNKADAIYSFTILDISKCITGYIREHINAIDITWFAETVDLYITRCKNLYAGTLKNTSNKCYINAVIQALCHCKLLETQILHRETHDCGKTNCLLRPLQSLISSLIYSTSQSSIDEAQDFFIKKISGTYICTQMYVLFCPKKYIEIRPKYDGVTQEDVHEFLLFILNDACILDRINDVVSNQTKSVVTCLCCGQASTQTQAKTCVSVSLYSGKTLPAIQPVSGLLCKYLTNMGVQHILDDMHQCSKCGTPTVATKKDSILATNKVLILLLKRFGIDDDGKLNKIQTHIVAPYNLKTGEFKYKLTSIIFHHGSMERGHYTNASSVNNGTGDHWLFFDDFEKHKYTESIQDHCKSASYILFYQVSA